jgi:hypothetical protein
VLEDSGIPVTPPERRRSGRIAVQGKVQQEASRKHRGSDKSESGDSGSEYEQEESGKESEGSIENELEKEVSLEFGLGNERLALIYIDRWSQQVMGKKTVRKTRGLRWVLLFFIE